tara:strand:+ start:507 stop:806 length:300 start_codon:yes stop_codon:yes gene_type:complete
MLTTYDQIREHHTQFGNVTKKRKEVSMPNQEKPSRYIEEKTNNVKGGRIASVEGGLRIDVFDHDENSEYDFTEDDCSLCELPEHAQNLIIEDIEYEQNA